ncbi:hypothetical protein MRX96_035683 [Rhipicephalus microplus]
MSDTPPQRPGSGTSAAAKDYRNARARVADERRRSTWCYFYRATSALGSSSPSSHSVARAPDSSDIRALCPRCAEAASIDRKRGSPVLRADDSDSEALATRKVA